MLEHWLGGATSSSDPDSTSSSQPSLSNATVVSTTHGSEAADTSSGSSVEPGPTAGCLYAGCPPWMYYFAAACCGLFMLVGIPGNLITVAALFRTKKLKNATAVFIMNLSISDLMFCCFNLPLAASTFLHGAWIHGSLLCQLFPLLRYGLVAVSLFTVLAITINRYVMIGHPRRYPKIYKRKHLALMVLATWLGGFGALVPTLFGRWGRFGLDHDLGSCSILPDDSGRSPKVFLFVLAFLAPCAAIVVCYARIFYIVRRTARKSRRRDDAARELLHCGAQAKRGSKNAEPDSAIGSMSCHATHTSENGGSSPPRDAERCNEHQDESRGLAVPELRVPTALKEGLDKKDKSNDEKEDEEGTGPPPAASPQPPASPVLLDTRSLKTSSNQEPSSRYLSPPYADDQLSVSEDGGASSRSNSPSPSERRIGAWRSSQQSVRRKSRSIRGTRSTRHRHGGAVGARETGRMTEKDKKLLKMILVIFSAFVVCYLPITISKTFKGTIFWRGLDVAGYILIYLTTCINPVIYVVMSSEYRSAYKNVLLCRSESRGSAGDRRRYRHSERAPLDAARSPKQRPASPAVTCR